MEFDVRRGDKNTRRAARVLITYPALFLCLRVFCYIMMPGILRITLRGAVASRAG